MKNKGSSNIFVVVLYVDDLLFIKSNWKIIEEFKIEMIKKYEMSDMGLLHYFSWNWNLSRGYVQKKIYQEDDGVFISKEVGWKYYQEV